MGEIKEDLRNKCLKRKERIQQRAELKDIKWESKSKRERESNCNRVFEADGKKMKLNNLCSCSSNGRVQDQRVLSSILREFVVC